MPSSSTRRDLFINVGGSTSDLQAAMKGARATLYEFDAAAGPIMDQLAANVRKLGPASQSAADETAGSVDKMIRSIGRLQAAGNDNGALLKAFDVNALDAQIAKAEQAAAQNRMIAQTAEQVALRGGEMAAVQLQIAAAFGTVALRGEEELVVLRQHRAAFGEVGEAMQNDVALQEAVAHGANKASIAKMELMHVVRSSSDAFAAGAPPMQIFAMEMGRVAQAASYAGGEGDGVLAKFGMFMSGGWGIAITVGVAVLAPFVAKLFEAGNATEKATAKLKEQADQARVTADAQAAFDQTLTGIIAKETKLADELERQLKTRQQLNQEAVTNATGAVTTSQKDFDAAAAKRWTALQELNAAKADGRQIRIDAADARYKTADKELTDATEALAQSRRDQRAAERVQSRDRAAAMASPTGPAGLKLDTRQQTNDDNYDVGRVTKQQYDAENDRIAKARAALGSKPKPTHDPSSSSSALLASAERYRGDTEGGTGRSSLMQLFSSAGISIDPKITAWCAAFVNAVLATNGLHGTGSLSAKSFLDYGSATNSPQKGDIVVLNRKGGGHVGFFEGYDKKGDVRVLGGNTGNKVAVETFSRAAVLGYRRAPGSAQGEATSAESAADKEANRQKAFDDQLGRAQADNLRAQLALARGTEDQVGIQLDQIAAEKAKADADVKAGLATGKLLPAEAGQLLALNRSTEYLEGVAVLRAEQHRQLEQAVQDGRDELDRQASLLDLQGSMARTQKERLAIALQLLAIDEKKRRQAAQAVIDDPTSTDRDRNRARDDIDQIDREQPYREAQARRQYASPLEQYRQQLRDATGDMDSSLEQIAAHGMSDLNDQVSQTIEKFLGLHGVMGTIIGDFIRLAAQRAELSLLDRLMGGGSSKSITSLGSALGSLFGHATGHVPGFAAGLISGPGTGTSDSILGWMEGRGLIKVSAGESIMTAEATRQHGPLLKAMNDNVLPRFATGLVPANLSYPSVPSAASLAPAAAPRMLTFDLRGAVVSEDLLRQMESIANDASIRVVTDSAPTIISAAADHTLARFGRPRL